MVEENDGVYMEITHGVNAAWGRLEEAQWSGVRQKDACGAKRVQNGDQVGNSVWGRVKVNNEKHIQETGGEMYVDVSMDE